MIDYAERAERIYRMRKDGTTFREIGERFSISGGRARQIYMKEEHRVEGCVGNTYCYYCGRSLRGDGE